MLTCKVCNFKSKTEIVAHIEAEHGALAEGGDVLEWYMAKYEADIKDVVADDGSEKKPSKGAGAKSVESTGTAAAAGMVKILNEALPLVDVKGHEDYIPKLNKAYHFNDWVDDLCVDIKESRKIMLTGHTGCGKTSAPEQIAARTKQGVIKVNMNQQTTYADFVGTWIVKGGDMVWVDGVLPKAMREGLWLIVDEFDYAEANILGGLNPVLEPDGKLILKEKGFEIVKPHPNFRLFATANTAGVMAKWRGLYQGTNLMNEATLDRFKVYHVDYLKPDDEIKVLIGSVTRMTPKIAPVIVRVGGMVREAFLKEEIQCTFSLRRLIDWSDMMIRHKDPIKAAETTIFSKVSSEDAEVIKGLITRVMVGNKS